MSHRKPRSSVTPSLVVMGWRGGCCTAVLHALLSPSPATFSRRRGLGRSPVVEQAPVAWPGHRQMGLVG